MTGYGQERRNRLIKKGTGKTTNNTINIDNLRYAQHKNGCVICCLLGCSSVPIKNNYENRVFNIFIFLLEQWNFGTKKK